ncbi:PTS sugar transporter subunit IIC [Sporolactobacillus sp. KGMB 08714]|uniref:PTS sugar transporter subunit IIC n=1 Tax=Sporolactobacillus sp. KGMB 08714 TaxID=3064704 RepID=UPI002FBEFFF5
MQKFMKWMTDVVGPKADAIAQNPWVAGIQDAINRILPMILVGSLITIYNVVRNYINKLPDMSDIRSYTFGLVALFMAFLIPYFIMEHKKHDNMKYIAGLTGLSLFMITVNPQVLKTGYLYQFDYFGAGGMFVAIIAGLFVAVIMNVFASVSFFKEDSAMPQFIQQWFDALIPIFIVVFVGWLIVIQIKFDLYNSIIALFKPLISVAQTYPGMLLLYLIPTIFFSLGISGWVFTPILTPIALTAITANAAIAAAGGHAVNIFCDEVTFALIALGGRGCTLPLSVMMLRAKSQKLKAIGKTCIGPSILNINEPLVFSTVAWNPMLMIPMWINAVVSVTIVYFTLKVGLVAIPTAVFSLWYTPSFLQGFFVSGFGGVVLTAVVFAVTWLIWYPFYKIYDNKCLAAEVAGVEDDD